jgi:glutathione synthase/RimK-type ligase-like ATP-grasp enzyme
MILILTNPEDATAGYVTRRLQEQQARFIQIDNNDFPSQIKISIAYAASGELCYRLTYRNETFDLSEIKAAWYRRPLPPYPKVQLSDRPLWNYVRDEAKSFINALWQALDCLWVPGSLSTLLSAEDKIRQLQLAGSLGFELPPTLITNNPAEFLDFYHQNHGNVISKALHRSTLVVGEHASDAFAISTWPVSNRDLGYVNSIRYSPTIFQAYIPKRLELRVTVVGKDIFPCEIHSQQTYHTRYDWRHYDLYNTVHRQHHLPDEVQRLCLQLVEHLGLCYGAIDLILTPDGRYVFLETNPNGQFAWIEDLAGLPISEAICNLLMSHQSKIPAVGSN